MKKYEPFIMEEDRLMLRTVRDFVEKEIMPVRKQLDDPQRGHHIYTELMEGLVHIRATEACFAKRDRWPGTKFCSQPNHH